MTEWFNRRTGDPVSVGLDEDQAMVLIGDQTPDWVRLPPELGSTTLKVLGKFRSECPMCEDGAPVKHLQCADGYGVAECKSHGFVWYRARNP